MVLIPFLAKILGELGISPVTIVPSELSIVPDGGICEVTELAEVSAGMVKGG